MLWTALVIALLKFVPMFTSTFAIDEKLTIATRSLVSSKLPRKLTTAGGSACAPPLKFIEPDLSNTNDIISLGRVTWALELMFNVWNAGRRRIKMVFIVAVASTLTSLLLLASVVTAMLSTGGLWLRPASDG